MPAEDGAEIGIPVSVRGREFIFVRDPYKSQKGSNQAGRIWHIVGIKYCLTK